MGCGSYRLYSCPGIFFLDLIKAYGLAKSLPLFNDKNIDAGVFYCNGQRYAVSPGNRKWETPAACFQSSGSEFEAGGNNKCCPGEQKWKTNLTLFPMRNMKLVRTTIAGDFECFYIFAPAQGLVAQWIEQQPSKLRVIGSNPIGVTQLKHNHLLTK